MVYQLPSGDGWPTLFRLFLVMSEHHLIIPLQYVNADVLILLLRVPDPSRGSKGRDLDECPFTNKHLAHTLGRGTSSSPPMFLLKCTLNPDPYKPKGPAPEKPVAQP